MFRFFVAFFFVCIFCLPGEILRHMKRRRRKVIHHLGRHLSSSDIEELLAARALMKDIH